MLKRQLAMVGVIALLTGCFTSVVQAARSSVSGPTPLIRLHVLANSESLVDQQVKVMVRDELLAFLSPLLQSTATPEEAERIIKTQLSALTNCANQALKRMGHNYSAKIQFGMFNFPDKHYGTFTLPAGRYQALNVTLGNGEGRNWWCVIFPPMCLTAGVVNSDEGAGQTVVIKSKLLELWDNFRAWCFRGTRH